MLMPTNALTGEAYRGINVISLWTSAAAKSFQLPIWATYRQWAQKGCQVRKGERASHIVFYREYQGEPDPERADDNGRRRIARTSCVFNADQVDGFTPTPEPQAEEQEPLQRIARADALPRTSGPVAAC